MSAVEGLRSTATRTRIHDAQMVFKLPKEAKALIAKVASDLGKSDGAVVRDALAEYFERRGYRS